MEKLSNVQKRRKPDRVVDKSRPGTAWDRNKKTKNKKRVEMEVKPGTGRVKSNREVGKAWYRKGTSQIEKWEKPGTGRVMSDRGGKSQVQEG